MRNKFAVTVLMLVILKCDGQMPDKAFLDQLLYSQGINPNDVIISSVNSDYSPTTTQNRPWQQQPQVVANTEPETIIVVVEDDQPSNPQYSPPTYNYNTNYKPPPNYQYRPGYNNQHGNHHHHHHHHRPGYNNQHGNHGGNGNHYGNNRPHNHYGGGNNHNINNGHYNQHQSTGNNEQDDTNEPALGNVLITSTNSPNPEPNKGTTAKNMDSTTKPSNKPVLVPLNPNQYMYQGDKIDINVPSNQPDENKKTEENEEDAPIDIRFGD